MNALLYILTHNNTNIHAQTVWHQIQAVLQANVEKLDLEDVENNDEYSVYSGKIRSRTSAGHIVEFAFFCYAGISEKSIFPDDVKIMSISSPKSDHQKELFYKIAAELAGGYKIYYQNDDYFDGLMTELDAGAARYELSRKKR